MPMLPPPGSDPYDGPEPEPHEWRAGVEIYQLVASLYHDGTLARLMSGIGRPEGDPTGYMGTVFARILARHRAAAP